MSALTAAIHARLSADPVLVGLLATYRSQPAVFTVDPAPGDAHLPYIVSAGEVSTRPFDTKNSRGREIYRDVRCYTDATGSAVAVEAIAEQVRVLLHRYILSVDGFEVIVAECMGPVVANEAKAYGRILTLRLMMLEA